MQRPVADVGGYFDFAAHDVYHAACGDKVCLNAERRKYLTQHLARNININNSVVDGYASQQRYYVYRDLICRRSVVGRSFGFRRGLGLSRRSLIPVIRRIEKIFKQLVEIRILYAVYRVVDRLFYRLYDPCISEKETAEIRDRHDDRLSASACAEDHVAVTLCEYDSVFSPFRIEGDEKFRLAALYRHVDIGTGQPLSHQPFDVRAEIRLRVAAYVNTYAERKFTHSTEQRFYHVGLRVSKSLSIRIDGLSDLSGKSLYSRCETVRADVYRKTEPESVVAVACRYACLCLHVQSVAVERSRKISFQPFGQFKLHAECFEKRGHGLKRNIESQRIGIDDYLSRLCRNSGRKTERRRRAVCVEPFERLLLARSEQSRHVELQLCIETRQKRLYQRIEIYIRLERGEIYSEQLEVGQIDVTRAVLGQINRYELSRREYLVRTERKILLKRNYHAC